jgi:hypothetical protein
MSLFGPESTWASPRSSVRLLAVLLAACALAFALTPTAGAQEAAGPAGAAESAATPEPPSDPPLVPDTPPIPEPPPPPEPASSPEPAASAPDPSPAPEPGPAAVDPSQPAERDAVAQAGPASFEPAAVTSTPAPQAPAAPVESSDPTAPTTAPLGWDVYDDALLAETFDDDGGAGSFGAGPPAVFRGLGALGTIAPAVERDRPRDANPPSRAEPMSAGGSGPGGSGPGQGPSLGLFGAAGGSGAGMALLTLLGLMCGWLLLAPLPKRAFLTSTAMWRPSAYVPPIDRPG